MKPSIIAAVLPELLFKDRRPVFLWGKSGVGKSSVVKQVAAANDLELRDVRMSQLDSIDLRGFPMPNTKNRSMEWLPPSFLPTKDDKPGILFLDEMNGAMPAVLAPSYQLILDNRIGDYVFPEHWGIVAAGNNMDDRGITHQMPAPLNNRFCHVDYEIDATDWHNRAAADEIHVNIRAYLRLKPASLHAFDSTINPRSFPTPRSWYMADAIYKNPAYPQLAKLELLRGTIGEGAAAEFLGFCRDIEAMPDIDSIMMNPEKAKLPGSQSVMHAVVTTLGDKATNANFDRIMKYVGRLATEIQVVFVRSAVMRDNRITNTKAYQDWGLKNQDVLT